MDKWEYIIGISKASDIYGDKLLELMDLHNKSNTREITYEEAKDFYEKLNKK